MRYLIVLLLAAVAALAYGQSPRQTSQGQTGRFVVVISNEGGTAWRLDTATGGLIYCLTAQTETTGLGNPLSRREAGCLQVTK